MNDKVKLQRGNALGDLIGKAVENLRPDDLPAPAAAAQPASDVTQVAPEKTRMNDLHRRMNETMQGSAIEELVESFRSVGQTQEVKGWRLPKPDENGVDVVLIYGARRRAAALKLGVPLRIRIVPKPTTAELIKEMHSENRARKDYLPLELAKELHAYLESKEYANATEMAASLGEDKSKVSRLLALLKLPREVLALYTDPTWLQLRAGAQLASLCEEERARERVVDAAKTWAKNGARGNPTATLLKAAVTRPRGLIAKELKDDKGHAMGTVRGSLSASQPLTLTLGKTASEAVRKDLAKVLEKHFTVKLL